MIIALDYDKTYTADPELWDDFIGRAIVKGHEIICITMRYNNDCERITKNIGNWRGRCATRIYYTSRKAKKVWADTNNIKVDIWIDDNPGWLFEDAL